jgi:polyhydroxybutyrate depolymerase
MSNGGYFTARLVCERADRIAAGVSVAALTHPDDCSPARAVPYRAYHGTDDRVVPYAGGDSVLLGPGVPDALRELFALSIRDEFEEFAADFGCALPADESSIGVDVTRLAYGACDGIPDLELFVVEGGGHTWPGSPLAAVLADGGLGAFTETVSATRDGWAFMSQHALWQASDS